jgi:hypothetical protein
MDDWLKQRADALAAASGIDRAALELSDEDAKTLLDLAKIAAHTSGERTNAPLLCYLLGVAHAGGLNLDELAETIR